MISYIEGTIKYIDQKSVCVLTKQGVGYAVQVQKNILESVEIDSFISFYIYTHVREDAFDLYGFINTSEKLMFEQLTSISGIGPRSALQILSLSDAKTLYEHVVQNNVAYLTQISGIGKKIAEKIVLELRDKLPKLVFDFKTEGVSDYSSDTVENIEVFEALKSMGYSPKEAKESILLLPQSNMTLEEKIKYVLKNVHN